MNRFGLDKGLEHIICDDNLTEYNVNDIVKFNVNGREDYGVVGDSSLIVLNRKHKVVRFNNAEFDEISIQPADLSEVEVGDIIDFMADYQIRCLEGAIENEVDLFRKAKLKSISYRIGHVVNNLGDEQTASNYDVFTSKQSPQTGIYVAKLIVDDLHKGTLEIFKVIPANIPQQTVLKHLNWFAPHGFGRLLSLGNSREYEIVEISEKMAKQIGGLSLELIYKKVSKNGNQIKYCKSKFFIENN